MVVVRLASHEWQKVVSRQRRLLVALILNLSLVGALEAVGVTAHSIGVMAAGADYLADAAGIGIALVAFPLSRRYPRVHSIAAMVNGGWLLLLSALVVVAASSRLIEGTPSVNGLPVLIMSSIAMIFMIVAAFILKVDHDGDSEDVHETLSSRAVFLDTLADAASAAGVAITGGVILIAHGLYWLDPAVAIVIAAVIAFHAFRLLTDVSVALRR
jgi:cobalt-zinc-cadmium efflux system protein